VLDVTRLPAKKKVSPPESKTKWAARDNRHLAISPVGVYKIFVRSVGNWALVNTILAIQHLLYEQSAFKPLAVLGSQ